MNTLSSTQLQALRTSHPEVSILDVLPEESFAEAHIAGARNACVYCVDFLEQCAELIPAYDAPVVVYGSSAASLASATAAEKLARAGYTAIHDFKGGLAEWSASGLPIESQRASEAEPTGFNVTGAFVVDTAASPVHWTGRSFTGQHSGTVPLSQGTLHVNHGRLANGAFILDMTQMENDDISDSKMRQVLINHLQSDDFFDVARFPTATFEISRATPIRGAESHLHVTGTLSMKARTHAIAFPCRARIEGDRLLADAELEMDRTRWNVLYGSTRFYEMLDKHFVSDLIQLRLHIEAIPA